MKFTSTAQTRLPYPAALPYCQRRWSHPTQLCCTALLTPTTLIAPHPHALWCLPLSPFPPQYQVSPFRAVFLNLWVETHGGRGQTILSRGSPKTLGKQSGSSQPQVGSQTSLLEIPQCIPNSLSRSNKVLQKSRRPCMVSPLTVSQQASSAP